MKMYRIAIDFDGTIVDHRYPRIGKKVDGAFEWMKKWQEAGAMLILWTMRSGASVREVGGYCAWNGIVFDGMNKGPGDSEWTDSPKVYAHTYVDDAAFGCPLKPGPLPDSRPVVDWSIVGPDILEQINAFNQSTKN